MSNMSEDIQYAGSDTRPPMLDRTDFESWQQRIRLYCLGKDNGENIMKSINEGPFQMGTLAETLAEETKGPLQQGSVRARVFTDLLAQEKERYKADIRATNILLQGIPKDIYTLINHYTDAKDIWDNVKMILEGSELTKDDRESQLYDEFEHFHQIKGVPFKYNYVQHEVHASENRMMMERFIQPTNDPLALVSNASVQQYPTQSSMSPQSSNEPSPADNFQLDSGSSSTENLIESLTNTLVLLTQSYKSHLPQTNNQLRTSSNARNKATVQDGRVVVQDVRGRYNANNQGRPFQRNNARGNVVARNAGGQNRGGNVTNFDDDVDDPPEKDLALNVDHIFEADQCDAFDSDVDEAPNIQTITVHDTFVDHMDEYHEVHEMQTDVQHNYVVDFDAEYTSDSNIIPYNQYVEDNEENGVQSRLVNKPDKVVNDSLTSELARYKELVGEYEKRAKFELTDRERKIDEQMRIIISDRNRKETSLKSELHSVQMQLRSTLGHYKSKTEEVTILKKDFKQKEDKFLEEFLDIKRLKEKVEDRLYKQDQSVQTVHMLCKPKSFYDEKNKVAIGYKNPLYLTHAKQVQSALYNGHEIVKTNHAPPVVHDSEDTREIAEITRKRMLEKMKSPLCVENKVKIAPRIIEKKVGPEYVVKQCAEIERKNLLIANENLIANCLSNQLMFAVEQSRCLYLEAEISKLQNENQKDVNDEMIRGFNKLEVEYLNLQLKYQHIQENFQNNKSQTSQDVPDFDSFFKIKILETQLQEKDNAIRNLNAQVSKMNDRSCETYNAKDVTALIEQNECVRVELEKVKQHYKELYDSIKITRSHTREKTSTMLNEIKSLKA
ncbi:hypothetical protein Tco_0012857 [Tanacetum coccineum]